jgi:V8-like Glu-specific endopeptidase
MSDSLAPAVVRVLTRTGEVAGAGFLLDDTTVSTCAHVVARALGTDERAAEAPKTSPRPNCGTSS